MRSAHVLAVSEPAPGQSVVERPPPGLARGKQAASPWTIGAVALVALLVTALYFAARWRKRTR